MLIPMEKNKKNWLSSLLIVIFGPFGMFFWGLRVGLASLVGIAVFILITTILSYGVDIKYQLLIRIVYLIIHVKLLRMDDQETENLRHIGVKEFLYLSSMILLNFLFFGFLGFIAISILKRF